jgi:hypothetical protein
MKIAMEVPYVNCRSRLFRLDLSVRTFDQIRQNPGTHSAEMVASGAVTTSGRTKNLGEVNSFVARPIDERRRIEKARLDDEIRLLQYSEYNVPQLT